ETKRARASKQIPAVFRVALTGTPIENYLEDLWSLFATICPGLLGTRQSFQRRFSGPIGAGGIGPIGSGVKLIGQGALGGTGAGEARQALKALVRPFILRRTKSAVLTELPPRTEQIIEVDLPEDERAFYEALRRHALEELEKKKAEQDVETGVASSQKFTILTELTKLRRACCHPALIDPQTRLKGAKLTAFMELVGELVRGGHKALVFSQFVGHLAQVRHALDVARLQYQYLDGSTPERERQRSVKAFQSGEGDLFLISLKAGGQGLNLTAADYVIHLDPWWNPAVEDQASDRAHRMGQERPVTVYRLVIRDSVEERILKLHRSKRSLAADFL
ncbi:MAG: DEAD/DEAH box helicase, partial [Bilophila sp.]